MHLTSVGCLRAAATASGGDPGFQPSTLAGSSSPRPPTPSEPGPIFIATNNDRTIPTARGIGPGNGLLVGVVESATGVAPIVAGKPHTR